MKEDADIRCPRCNSGALYKFGKTKWGKQRFQCLMCKRQFSLGTQRVEVIKRPTCPQCGAKMHSYIRDGGVSRFRCSKYPACNTYLKFRTEEEEE